jgi:hypothetical protein
MANHQDLCVRICTTLIPALKAPPHASPGQRPGFRNRSVRPARAEESSALAGQNMDSDTSPGRCLGLASSAPMARHRGCVLERRKLLRSN